MHAVVFDIDGTLVHSAEVDEALYRASVRSVLGPVRFRASLADYRRVTDAGILQEILGDNSIEFETDHEAAVKSAFVDAFRGHIDLHGPFAEIPGAKSFLESLRGSDAHSVAIATGGWRETALLKLDSAGFDVDGLPLATSDDARDRADIMHLALSQLGNDFATVTYYGDGPWDRAACEHLGWRFVPVGSALGGLTSYHELIAG